MKNTKNPQNIQNQQTQQKPKRSYMSTIAALEYVSESEILALFKDYTSAWETDRPEFMKRILFQFGLDVNQYYERQDAIQHRNRMNQIVVCSRWVGQSRLDAEWINSGLARQEAKDKVKNSRLLDDLYRAKCMTEDAQAVLESRDRYYVQPEDN